MHQDKVTSGRSEWSRGRRLAWLSRNNLTLGAAAAAFVLTAILVAAIYDFVTTAKRKDQQIQEAALRGHLVEFLLMTTREPDGSTLLENPADFARAQREAKIVSIRRPFFNYFLTKGNAKSYRTDVVRFEPPRACVLEYPGPGQNQVLHACFAVIPSDPAGRYVYFTLRYPVSGIEMHRRGRRVVDGDRVLLRFVGDKDVSILLAFERPPMTERAKGAAVRRFDGLYEMAAFLPAEGGRSTRMVNAQAIKQTAEGAQSAILTILGRIDSAMLPGGAEVGPWPSKGVKAARIGVEVTRAGSAPMGFQPGTVGTTLVSLEEAYRAAVPARAKLEIKSEESDGNTLWRASELDQGRVGESPGWFQRLGDRLVNFFVAGAEKVGVTQRHHGAGLPPFTATLTAEGIAVPDIAARALVWLLLSLVAIALLCLLMWRLFWRLEKLTATAYAVARAHHGTGFEDYARRKDQIGTLGRVIHLLYKRHRERMVRHKRRMERENAAVRRRHDNLQAIGHEIKSPLANLLTRISSDSKEYRELTRMRRAIEALYEASRIEDGLKNGTVVPKVDDVAAYLAEFVENSQTTGDPIVYCGPTEGCLAVFDDLGLDQVIEQLIDNAIRHKTEGTNIEIRIPDARDSGVTIEVFNHGAHVADAEQIFALGFSDHATDANRGLGLYAARIYIEAVGGTMQAENRPGGFAIVITLRPGSTHRRGNA